MTQCSAFHSFKTCPEIICLAMVFCVRYQLSLRTVEELLAERGIEIGPESVQLWWNRFGSMFTVE
jgi:putative transposase